MKRLNRPRILVLTSTFPRWTGDAMPDFVERLAEHLAGGFRITVLAPHYPGSLAVERWKNFTVIRYRYFWPARCEKLAYGGGLLPNIKRSPWLLLLLPFLLLSGAMACYRLLRSKNVSLLHAHWIIPQGLYAGLAKILARRSTPVLVTSHGGDLWALQGRTGRKVKKWTLRRCSAATVVSSAMKPAVKELAPHLPVTVIPMGTEMSDFSPPVTPAPLNRLLFVGRLTEKKGADVAIHALSLLNDHEDLQLTIVGNGPLRAQLAATARELGLVDRVTFAGWADRKRVADLFRGHGIFVFPSVITGDGDQEGLGLTLVEAMASGCTVIASSLPAVADLVINEKTGLTFPSGDPEALGKCVNRLLAEEDMARRLAVNARAHVEARFSMERVSTAFRELYDDLI